MKEISVLDYLKLLKTFLQLQKDSSLTKLKEFVRDFYSVENMPDEFYELLSDKLPFAKTYKIISAKNIHKLISYLKYDSEDTSEIEGYLSPKDYFSISKHHINKLLSSLKQMPIENNMLSEKTSEDIAWKLRRRPTYQYQEFQEIAYKLYQAFGFENAIELISEKYGPINYDQLHYLIKNIEPLTLSEAEINIIRDFLFGNKKDFNNPLKQMLSSRFNELFLNFDYFYNNITYFIEKLGRKLPIGKIKLLLEERYLTSDPTTPEITGEIRDDMLSSYYHKYTSTDTPTQEVVDKNTSVYITKLRNKYSSSIPQIKLASKGEIIPELLNLSDPRNLTHGYRSGNCFRLNGDASILFSKFLDSEHMRILSFSTPEYKDYAMVLLMRNGNVLIAQGIETSKWAPSKITGENLYEATKESIKQIMDYMNANGDEIVGTVIGATNQNVSSYNNQILPFLVGPLLENSSNYYNGISNYQCLLDLASSKSIYDMKTYEPQARYFDQRESILSRKNYFPEQTIERRIISLRYQRTQTEEGYSFYETLSNHQEQETVCNKDWYITLFTDKTIDSYLSDTPDPRAKSEFQQELVKIYQKIGKQPPKL